MSYNPHVSGDGVTLRASTVSIGTSYDSSPTAFRTQNWNQLILFCDLTLNTATDVRIKLEFASPVGDATPAFNDWFQQTYADTANAASASGVETVPLNRLEWQLTATGRYALPVPMNYKWGRASAQTTSGPGSTTLSIYATEGLA